MAPPEKPAVGDYDGLVGQVRQAMNELKDGKVVLAYQTLEQALQE
jgi:hypothetical protein